MEKIDQKKKIVREHLVTIVFIIINNIVFVLLNTMPTLVDKLLLKPEIEIL